MICYKMLEIIAFSLIVATSCLSADVKEIGEKTTTATNGAHVVLFSTNTPGGQAKSAPFSAEIGADFMKKVMETSARIGECKKQIAERQVYLYENNPQIKACRGEMIEAQMKINTVLEADKELVELRLNRDILWTTMPTLPKGRDQSQFQPGANRQMGPTFPAGLGQK